MIDVRVADADETLRWRAEWHARMDQWYGGHGVAGWSGNRMAGWDAAPERGVFTLVADDVAVGHVAIALADQDPKTAVIHDLVVDPGHRGRGHGRAARAFAERWARARAEVIGVRRWTADPAAIALFAGYGARNQKMVKRLGLASLPDGVVARPMDATEYQAWLANDIRGFAADLSDSGTLAPAEAEEFARNEYAEMVPDGLATPGFSWWMVDAGGVNVAAILLGRDERGIAWVYSVEVRPEHRGRGYGRAAMLVGEAAAAAAGDAVLALNVFGHNVAAIRLYESLDYAVVDETRSALLQDLHDHELSVAETRRS